MSLIIPYNRVNLLNVKAWTDIVVNWRYDIEDPIIFEYKAVDIEDPIFESSFVALLSPGGKIWRSLFIPLSKSGTVGVSISYTSSSAASKKGRLIIRQVSETSWYTGLKTNIGKGHTPLTYMGRNTPIKSSHEFVRDIVNDKRIPQIPCMGLSESQADGYIWEKMPGVLHKALYTSMPPIKEMFDDIGISQIDELENQARYTGLSGYPNDVLNGFIGKVLGSILDNKNAIKNVKTTELNKIREDYGSNWGRFC